MQDTHRPLSKNYHLQNSHNRGFELAVSTTSDSRPLNDRFTKKQHFVQGRVSLQVNPSCFRIDNYSLVTTNRRMQLKTWQCREKGEMPGLSKPLS